MMREERLFSVSPYPSQADCTLTAGRFRLDRRHCLAFSGWIKKCTIRTKDFTNGVKGEGPCAHHFRYSPRAPILFLALIPITGSFAVWGVMFSCCDCTITHFRKKEDAWNAIASGAVTGGILAARAGMKAAGKSALFGGLILAAIEGLSLAMSRVFVPFLEKQTMASAGMPIDTLEPPSDPSRPRNAYPKTLHTVNPTPFGF